MCFQSIGNIKSVSIKRPPPPLLLSGCHWKPYKSCRYANFVDIIVAPGLGATNAILGLKLG